MRNNNLSKLTIAISFLLIISAVHISDTFAAANTTIHSEKSSQMNQLLDEIFNSPMPSMVPYIGRILNTDRNDQEIAKLAMPYMTNNKHLALILLSAKFNNIELFKKLLLKYPDFEPIEHQFKFTTPTEQALNNGNLEIVKLIVDTWGKSSLSALESTQAIEIAAAQGSAKMVAYFSSLNNDNVIITDELKQKLLLGALKYGHIETAQNLAKSLDHVPQDTIYYAAILGDTAIIGNLLDKPNLDFTQPASINNNYDISGKTAPDIALAHGHQEIAQMLDKRMSEQLETKKFEQDKELAQQKKDKARETREALLAEETPQFGQLKVNVLHRYLGFKGVKRSKKLNSWKSPAGGVKALSILVKADKSYPLHFGYWGDDRDLELSISQKRGLTKLSAMTNDVYLFSAEGEILHFTFSKRGDTSFKAIAPILIEKLNKALTENSSAIAQIKTARDQKIAAKAAKVKKTREQEHDQTMLTIRTYLKNKEYLAAVSLIEKIEQQGIYQSDNLGYIKARMLYKLGHNDQARTALRLYIAEHEESGSKYVIKAKQLLELL